MVIVDGYIIDAALREGHSFPAEVTQHPAEEGADTADHYRTMNASITIDGIVSDTPLDDAVAAARTATTLPSAEALERLRNIQKAKKPVTIVTSKGEFTSMMLTNLDVPEDEKTGDALLFTATFQEIRFATNNRVIVQVASPRGKAKVNRGNKASKERKNVPPDNRSASAKLFDAATGDRFRPRLFENDPDVEVQ